jgi:hypothetical protein
VIIDPRHYVFAGMPGWCIGLLIDCAAFDWRCSS